METIGAFEAKTHFSALLARVRGGERVTITHRGRPVAMLVPVEAGRSRLPAAEVVARFRRARRGLRLAGTPVRELIEAGRRR